MYMCDCSVLYKLNPNWIIINSWKLAMETVFMWYAYWTRWSKPWIYNDSVLTQCNSTYCNWTCFFYFVCLSVCLSLVFFLSSSVLFFLFLYCMILPHTLTSTSLFILHSAISSPLRIIHLLSVITPHSSIALRNWLIQLINVFSQLQLLCIKTILLVNCIL